MDTKITLRFDKEVIENAKKYAAKHQISLSRLVERLLRNVCNKQYSFTEDLPVSEWVSMVAEDQIEYQATPKTRKQLKEEFHNKK